MREGDVEAGGDVLKEQDYNRGVIDEGLWPDLVKTATIVLVRPWDLSELKYLILDSNLPVMLVELENKAFNIAEVV